MYPASLKELIENLSKLPSIGPKSAERIAIHLLNDVHKREEIINSLQNLNRVKCCGRCNSLTEGDICTICEDPEREKEKICIVEQPYQVDILERSGAFKGTYYVLQGSISPLEGKGPEALKVERLLKRIEKEGIKEIILAVNEDFTLHYMIKLLKPYKIKLFCLAKGIPVGSKIEYMDELTLKEAFKGRREI